MFTSVLQKILPKKKRFPHLISVILGNRLRGKTKILLTMPVDRPLETGGTVVIAWGRGNKYCDPAPLREGGGRLRKCCA